MVAVSWCLAGRACRYDGTSKTDTRAKHLADEGAVCICPEVMGGLPVPREPAEIVDGDGYDVLGGRAKVMTASGRDVTAEYLAGAEKALEICLKAGVTCAVLKANSPSCGSGCIYDGSFSGEKKQGDGVTAALLKSHGITVIAK